MQPAPANRTPPPAAPRFYVTARQPLSPAAVLLALLTFVGGSLLVGFALSHSRKAHRANDTLAGSTSSSDEDRDDPSQVDVIVLGDPVDAPVPARKGRHTSSVHPTVLIRLPRFGPQVGLIPSSPAGHLLYGWLAAFNQGSASALAQALPNGAPADTGAAQLELRRQTGGFNLLSAAEPEPGLLVFRLRDQTPMGGEALGTLQVTPTSNPPAIASFSLRAVSP